MQTTKTRTGSLEVRKRTSPATSQTSRQQKTPGTYSDSNLTTRCPNNRSSKIDGKSSYSSASELKKHPGKASDLKAQLARLQEELKEAKEQLASSESWRKRAQQDNEEAKKQLAAMAANLKESQQQILELSSSEDVRVQELRMISQDRDRAWESELEAVKKHHAMDSAALASAKNDIQKLKSQLERAESEAAQARNADLAYAEAQSLRLELTQTLSLVDNLKSQIRECKESEVQGLQLFAKSVMQSSMEKSSEETWRSECLRLTEAYNSMATELDQSKNQVCLLEEVVSKLQADGVGDSEKNAEDASGGTKTAPKSDEHEELNQAKGELDHVKSEVVQLRLALQTAERRYQEEYIGSTLQIRGAYELVELTKSEYRRHEAELEANLKAAKAEIEELKSKLMGTETKICTISEQNQGFNLKVMESELAVRGSDLELELKNIKDVSMELRASSLEKEKELGIVRGQNEALKLEMVDREVEKNKMYDEMREEDAEQEAGEQEGVMKQGHLTEKGDTNSRKAVRVAEQLDAAEAEKWELEAELRRLKVQANQWRKAAEAAAAMLSTGNNGIILQHTSDDNYYRTTDDMDDDDSLKKKNVNMLKKLGVLLKKGQK